MTAPEDPSYVRGSACLLNELTEEARQVNTSRLNGKQPRTLCCRQDAVAVVVVDVVVDVVRAQRSPMWVRPQSRPSCSGDSAVFVFVHVVWIKRRLLV